MEEGIAAAKDHSPPSGSGSMEGVEEEEVLAVQHHPGGLNSFFKRLLGNNPLDAPLSGFGLNPPSHSADVSRLERFQSPVVASSSLSSDDNDPNDEDTMSMQCVNSDDPSLSSSSTSSGGAFMVDSNTGDVEEDMSEDSADISSQKSRVTPEMRKYMEGIVKGNAEACTSAAMRALSSNSSGSHISTDSGSPVQQMDLLLQNQTLVGGVLVTIRVEMTGGNHFPLQLNVASRMANASLVIGRVKSVYDSLALGVFIDQGEAGSTGTTTTGLVAECEATSVPLVGSPSDHELIPVVQAGWVAKQIAQYISTAIDRGVLEIRSACIAHQDSDQSHSSISSSDGRTFIDLQMAVSSDHSKRILLEQLLPSQYFCCVDVDKSNATTEHQNWCGDSDVISVSGVSPSASGGMDYSGSPPFSPRRHDTSSPAVIVEDVDDDMDDVDLIDVGSASAAGSSSATGFVGSPASAGASSKAFGESSRGKGTVGDPPHNPAQHDHNTRSGFHLDSSASRPDVALKHIVVDVNNLPEILDTLAGCAEDLKRILNSSGDQTNLLTKRQLSITADIITRVCQTNSTGHANSKLSKHSLEWCADGQIQIGAKAFEHWFRSVIPLAGLTSNYKETRRYRTGASDTFHHKVKVVLFDCWIVFTINSLITVSSFTTTISIGDEGSDPQSPCPHVQGGAASWGYVASGSVRGVGKAASLGRAHVLYSDQRRDGITSRVEIPARHDGAHRWHHLEQFFSCIQVRHGRLRRAARGGAYRDSYGVVHVHQCETREDGQVRDLYLCSARKYCVRCLLYDSADRVVRCTVWHDPYCGRLRRCQYQPQGSRGHVRP